jgi:hypothetical protein
VCPWTEKIRPGAFFHALGVHLRITRGDGLIDRDHAAELCGVTPDAVTIWATRGYMVTVAGERVRRFLPVAKREGRKPLYDPVEVQKAELATRKRGRREVRPAFPVAA